MLRTHTCGELNKKHDGKKVKLCGWVEQIRTFGKIGFLTIKDKYGSTQAFLNPNLAKEFGQLRKESVILLEGKVQIRPQKDINKDMVTGEIELSAEKIEILNESAPVPLDLTNIQSTEETRLKYRYLDLRRKKMQKNLAMRHKTAKAVRDFLDKENFLEIETPMIAKSTPEGARDYLIPSRVQKGKFYALPQSPQLFKQLLMVSGFDKYFQLVKCFRDEDLRADRQPEFTQIDMEMSFIEEEDIYSLLEKMMKHVFKQVLDVNIETPFPRITYKEAMNKYHTDRPHLKKDGHTYSFLWVVDFPLFEYSKEEKRLTSTHHPFTMPKEEDIKLLEKEPEKASSNAYDLVLNGEEIAGGSIRIHKADIQKKIFKALKLSDEEVMEKFGFLLNAFKYGAPPHGGIAFGLDRLVAIICGEDSIREVIAFPKNKDAKDIMLDAPSDVSKKQLSELGLKTN
ncbi:aspartate--tRNA ligase [Candidatus Woesearchaeota archaeon]|nr:aspartate--tRNA ligase [Candidatus Woesearchaeota archaeon]MBL7051224.1 aspartate--tRNA ligase [Candidatus Woesearchaeota archaeon]